jgi:tetratricopeptide (TPR) repeat protein
MLVRFVPLSIAVAAVFVAGPTAFAAPRAIEWTAGVAAVTISPEEAERAFARPAIDGSADPVVRVDESALRYYASQHAQTRVEAEIRRLRALYPGWEPPADLYRPAGAGEDQALWDLYGKGKIDDVKLEIDRRMARQPGWRPSPEMVEKLRRKEMRQDLVTASDRGDWAAVTGLAEREPLLLDGADLDVIWRVAEATAKTGTAERALDLYRVALTAAPGVDERLATVRKAMTALGPEAVAPLMAEERNSEFEPARLDLARARIGETLKPGASGAPQADDLARLTAAAKRDDGSAGDAALLGWVELGAKRPEVALDWFETARKRGGDAKAALGAVLAADRAGRHDRARDLAEQQTDDAEIAALYLDLVVADISGATRAALSPERTALFARTIEKLESGDAAQALAWYAYDAHQFEAARAWFAKAMAWRPSAKSAEGHLLALKALGDRPTFEKLSTDYRDRFADLVPVPGFARVVAVGRGGPRKKSCGEVLATGGRRSAGDELAAGWCLMDLARGEEAIVAFEKARASDGRLAAEAAYGLSLAHLRAGRTDAAASVAASGALGTERRDEIGRIALAQQAIARFDAQDWRGALDTLDRRRRHAAEPRDLATMRGWALYHLGLAGEAHEIFVRLDAQMSTRETRMGVAATTLGPTARY